MLVSYGREGLGYGCMVGEALLFGYMVDVEVVYFVHFRGDVLVVMVFNSWMYFN